MFSFTVSEQKFKRYLYINFVSCNLTELINSFLVASLRFSMCRIMSLANSYSFMSSLPIWIPFFFFSDALSRKLQTMLNESGESRHPYLVPDLRGNAFSFLPLSLMLVVCLSYMGFAMLRYIFSMQR